MCGILMAMALDGAPLDEASFDAALRELRHRGPDVRQLAREGDGRLLLGQNVLSITGSPHADQERYGNSPSGRFRVVLNGEIYNHRELRHRYCPDLDWRTRSDTEVLAALFDVMGPDRIARELEGMYALIAYDRALRRLHIGRDGAGEKPLFRARRPGLLVFGSEVRALLRLLGGASLDVDTLRSYWLTRHFAPRTATEYLGIERVPAGAWFSLELGDARPFDLYSLGLASVLSPPLAGELADAGEPELEARLSACLDDVLGQMLPECESAAIVSGGVDSTLVAAGLRQTKRPPALLIGLDFDGLDPVARDRAGFERALNAEIEVHAPTLDEYTEALARFHAHHRGLMPTHSLVSMDLLSARVAQRGIRVLFGGDGADELLAGYAAYAQIGADQLRTAAISPSPYSTVSELPPELVGSRNWHRLHEALRASAAADWQWAVDQYAHIADASEQRFSAMLLLDCGAQLECVGLASSDRMAMLHSVEARSPFVHRRMLTLALNLPRRARLLASAPEHLRSKYLLKRVFAARLGEELIHPKQGFPGFPNAAGQRLCGTLQMAADLLELPGGELARLRADRAAEWKLINLELFLRHAGGSA